MVLGVGVSSSYQIFKTGKPYRLDIAPTILVSAAGLIMVLLSTLVVVNLNGYYINKSLGIWMIAIYMICCIINVTLEWGIAVWSFIYKTIYHFLCTTYMMDDLPREYGMHGNNETDIRRGWLSESKVIWKGRDDVYHKDVLYDDIGKLSVTSQLGGAGYGWISKEESDSFSYRIQLKLTSPFTLLIILLHPFTVNIDLWELCVARGRKSISLIKVWRLTASWWEFSLSYPSISYLFTVELFHFYLLRVKDAFTASTCFPLALTHYAIKQVIGKGAFGKVHLVQHKGTLLEYALKCIHKDRCVELRAANNMISERRLLERINYPLIVNLRYAFQDDDHLFMVLDLMLGGDLRFQLERNGPLSELQVRFYVAEIALSLAYLHRRRIAHR